jgi:DeoR family transcriptional regulator, ulaG and ulaABCDEF operon transcriptional repressor
MHESERWEAILTLLQPGRVVSVRDLSERLGASEATVRRDIGKLADDGLIERVHGGAKALSDAPRPPTLAGRAFAVARTLRAPQKRAIAEAAAALCHDGESIIINGGTTTFHMVEFLRGHRMQILTNSFPIAAALIDSSESQIILPGGQVYRDQGVIVSPFEDDAVQHYTATKMFMSAISIGPFGLVEADPLMARAEAKLMKRADELIVLLDSSKLRRQGNIVVCPLSRISTLITDDGASEAALEPIRAAGVDVILAPSHKGEIEDVA